MKKIKEYKLFAIAMLVLAIIIFLLPALHKQNYLIINNDTAAHLVVFEAIKNGNANFLYLGQAMTGYILVGIEKILGVNIPTSFMWFNFIALFLSGLIVAIMTTYITKSKLAGIISAPVIVFGIGSTMHLFGSGTIFNIIEVLVLLPILIILVYKMFQSKNIKWLFAVIPLAIFTFFFHPSFGQGVFFLFRETSSSTEITSPTYSEAIINPVTLLTIFFGISNLAALVLCSIAFYVRTNREKIKVETKVVAGTLLVLLILLTVLTFTGATAFSSRMAINLCLVLGMLLCLFMGIMLKHNQSKLVGALVISLVAIGVVPNLITWLSFPTFKGVVNAFLV